MSWETDLEKAQPAIRWREPVKMSLPTEHGMIERYACRFCIARYGIKGGEIEGLARTPGVVEMHIGKEHAG